MRKYSHNFHTFLSTFHFKLQSLLKITPFLLPLTSLPTFATISSINMKTMCMQQNICMWMEKHLLFPLEAIRIQNLLQSLWQFQLPLSIHTTHNTHTHNTQYTHTRSRIVNIKQDTSLNCAY